MSEKKVVAVIVEGPSDEMAIGSILKEHFSSNEVRFAVVHGDITSDYSTGVDNVVSKIETLIDGLCGKYSYNWTDFARIIHIADTDGVFAKECVRPAAVDSVLYFEDHIEAPDADATEKRNAHKSEILYKLSSTGKVHNVRYRIHFNSCNLEHVLYNELRDFSDMEKGELSDKFAEEYEGRVQDFIEFISKEDVAVAGTYKETWAYIRKGVNSLQRHSNMHLIFE